MEVRAVRKPAAAGEIAHLAEALGQVRGRHRAEPEFGHPGAIYKEADGHAVQPRGRCRLPPEPVARNLAYHGISAKRPEDRALTDARYAAEQRVPPRDGLPQALDVLAGLGIHDQRFVAERAVERDERLRGRPVREIRLCQYDERVDAFQLRKCEKLIECKQTRRRIGERGHGHHRVDVRRHRFRAALHRPALQRERPRFGTIDEGAPVFQKPNVHAISGCEHFPLAGRTFQVCDARRFLRIEYDARRIFTDGDYASREGFPHAPNDAPIVDWARTLRFDAAPSPALQDRIAALARDGVRVRVAGSQRVARTYALVEGPQGVDPAEAAQRIPEARWYDAAIIALAIEPLPADALLPLAQALGGAGAPAGVCECTVNGPRLLLEFRPDVTPASLVMRIIDVELRRFSAARHTVLLSPLSDSIAAAVAAGGLQAPEIAPDRILESLLGLERVE